MNAGLRIATFNIRYGTARDGANGWHYRRGAVLAQLEALDFDVCGLQEVLADQRGFLTRALAGSRWYGVGRTDGDRDGEQAPIVVRRERLVVEDWTTLWLSEQPRAIGSRGWDAMIPRVATVLYGRLAGIPVGLVNTHLDHRGRMAQVGSARLLADLVRGELPDGPGRERDRTGSGIGRRLAAAFGRASPRRAAFGTGLRRLRQVPPAGGEPGAPRRWIVMGDFNVELGSPTMEELTGSGLRSVLPQDAGGTFHGWSGSTDGPRIDHILVDDGWDVVSGAIVHDRPGDILPSDHWPVSVQLRLR